MKTKSREQRLAAHAAKQPARKHNARRHSVHAHVSDKLNQTDIIQ